MATLDDVARIALELPEVIEGEGRSGRSWSVGGKTFAWERAYSKADLKRFGDEPVPAQPVLAVRVDDLGEKEAVLAAGDKGFFTIPHFDGYAAVLIELRAVGTAAAAGGDHGRLGSMRSDHARRAAPARETSPPLIAQASTGWANAHSAAIAARWPMAPVPHISMAASRSAGSVPVIVSVMRAPCPVPAVKETRT